MFAQQRIIFYQPIRGSVGRSAPVRTGFTWTEALSLHQEEDEECKISADPVHYACVIDDSLVHKCVAHAGGGLTGTDREPYARAVRGAWALSSEWSDGWGGFLVTPRFLIELAWVLKTPSGARCDFDE